MHGVYRYVKPGGWVEFQDFDTRFYTTSGGEYNKDTTIGQWADRIADGLRKFGVEPDPGYVSHPTYIPIPSSPSSH